MDAVTAVTVVGSSVAVIVSLIPMTKAVLKLTRSVTEMRDDWFGEAARPGYNARPGIPERLQRIESQLVTNGGATLRDAVNRVEKTGERLEVRFQRLESRFDTHVEQTAINAAASEAHGGLPHHPPTIELPPGDIHPE